MNNLPACCCDFELEPLYLLFPDRLDADGQRFIRLHGIDLVLWGELRRGAVEMPGGRVRIMHRCNQLLDDGRCRVYENRPLLCRTFDCASRVDCSCGGRGRENA